MPLGYRITQKAGKLFFVMVDLGPYEGYVLWLQEVCADFTTAHPGYILSTL